jgi:hypothetical protein
MDDDLTFPDWEIPVQAPTRLSLEEMAAFIEEARQFLDIDMKATQAARIAMGPKVEFTL